MEEDRDHHPFRMRPAPGSSDDPSRIRAARAAVVGSAAWPCRTRSTSTRSRGTGTGPHVVIPLRERSGLRPFDPRLLVRARSVQWVLAADAAAGLAATLLLLLQVILVAGVVADAAEGRISSVSTGALAALAAAIAGRAGLAQVVETSGRRAATTVMSGDCGPSSCSTTCAGATRGRGRPRLG